MTVRARARQVREPDGMRRPFDFFEASYPPHRALGIGGIPGGILSQPPEGAGEHNRALPSPGAFACSRITRCARAPSAAANLRCTSVASS
jgi:hypothetical protein